MRGLNRFAEAKLVVMVIAVTTPGDAFTMAAAISEATPGIKLQRDTNSPLLRWDEIVEKKQETWPVWLLMPGGAYIQQAN